VLSTNISKDLSKYLYHFGNISFVLTVGIYISLSNNSTFRNSFHFTFMIYHHHSAFIDI